MGVSDWSPTITLMLWKLTLKLDANDKVSIESGFKVNLGGRLEAR